MNLMVRNGYLEALVVGNRYFLAIFLIAGWLAGRVAEPSWKSGDTSSRSYGNAAWLTSLLAVK